MAAAKKKQTSGKKSTAARRSSTASKKRGKASSQKKKAETNSVAKEVIVLIAFAVSAFLFLSNFHICGSIGDFFTRYIRGLFGAIGYLVPVGLFFGICLFAVNRGDYRVAVKHLMLIVLTSSLCGLIELAILENYEKATLAQYFEWGQQGLRGGLLGGMWLNWLYPVMGEAGSYIVLFILTLISFVMVTEKSILKPIKHGGERVMATAREDMDKRKVVRASRKAEQRIERSKRREAVALAKQKRAERKVSGVSLQTLSEVQEPAPAAESVTEPAAAYSSGNGETVVGDGAFMADASQFKGVINGFNYPEAESGTPASEAMEPEVQEMPEALDLHTAGQTSGRRTVTELKKTDEEVDQTAFVIDKETGQSPWAAPDDTQNSVRTIVTAGGRQIEAEIDASEDPLNRYRKQEESFRPASSGSGTFVSPAAEEKKEASTPPKPKKLKPYATPPVTFLKSPGRKGTNQTKDLERTAITLQQTLRSFGVGVTVTNISCGPAVTRYELLPEQGVKVSRIVSLSDDIKLNLAAADIRIEAPIPGKPAVGIEVPNKENQTVTFRELVDSEEFRKFPSKLAFAVGRDIGGQIIVSDLAKMPHLLIAGATGSGKSVCINTLIMSILYKAKPSEVKLIMVDPKVVELSIYNGIPHLMIPVVTDPKKAASALNWAVNEMTVRYKKFAQWNVRDLKGYNEKIKESGFDGEDQAPLPQIVIIVDELSDLMMVSPGEVEDAICRLAQMARAAGLHLVLATQRPSVNVITGLIKANVPSRIAFSVSSGVDSRTIIDMNGAEKLLGKGDMLFYPSGYQKPARIQGAFISDGEVGKVVGFLSERASDIEESDSARNLEEAILSASGTPAAAESGGSDRDEYFLEAGRVIIEKEKASIGMLQRVFKIGFNRAARIMDQLAEAGVVGDEEGTKARQILMTMEEFERSLTL